MVSRHAGTLLSAGLDCHGCRCGRSLPGGTSRILRRTREVPVGRLTNRPVPHQCGTTPDTAPSSRSQLVRGVGEDGGEPMISDSRSVILDSRFVFDRKLLYRRAASFAVVRMPTPRRLPRVNPRLGQLTVAEATIVPHVGLPTDRRAAALVVLISTLKCNIEDYGS